MMPGTMPGQPRNNLRWAVALAIAVWALLVMIQIVSPLWFAIPDSCGYLSIARSLATTGRPTNLGSDNLVYSIGYPILLAPIFRVTNSPFLMISVLHAVLTIVYLAGTYIWARRYAVEAALPIALLAVGNAIVLAVFRRVLSEVAFMAVMIWLINLLSIVQRDGRTMWRPLMAAAFLFVVLVMIRPAGLLFATGFGLFLLSRARQGELSWVRACLLTLAVALPATAVWSGLLFRDRFLTGEDHAWTTLDVLTRSTRNGVDFGDGTLLQQCVEGLRVRITEVGRLTIPGLFGAFGKPGQWLDLNMLVYIPWFGLLAFGWCRALRRRADVFMLSVPFYLALHICWPSNQGGRYFAPLVPVFILCLWFLLESAGKWRSRLIGGLVAAHLIAAMVHWSAKHMPRAITNYQSWTDVRSLATSIDAQPGTVEVASGMGDTASLLMYVLDRPVLVEQQGDSIEAEVHWLVVSVQDTGHEGFTTSVVTGKHKLLVRQP